MFYTVCRFIWWRYQHSKEVIIFNNWCIAEEERRKPHEGVDGGAGGGVGGESLPRIKRMPLPHFGRPLFEEIGALLLCGCGRLYCCDSRLPWCQEHWQGSKICSKGGEMLKIPILVAVVITVAIIIKIIKPMTVRCVVPIMHHHHH